MFALGHKAFVGLISLFMALSCKSRSPGAVANGDLKSVEITWVDRSGTFVPTKSTSYVLSGCGEGAKDPYYGAKDTILLFNVKGIIPGDGCRLEIIDQAAVAEDFVWLGGPGVSYVADFQIRRGSVGQLEGTAVLVRTFKDKLK